jgi:hypothetical protein
MTGMEACGLNQHECHAGIGGHVGKEAFESSKPSGGCADADG